MDLKTFASARVRSHEKLAFPFIPLAMGAIRAASGFGKSIIGRLAARRAVSSAAGMSAAKNAPGLGSKVWNGINVAGNVQMAGSMMRPRERQYASGVMQG